MVFIVGKKVLSLRYIAYMHFAKSWNFGFPTHIKTE
jgi:hypothetical protein